MSLQDNKRSHTTIKRKAPERQDQARSPLSSRRSRTGKSSSVGEGLGFNVIFPKEFFNQLYYAALHYPLNKNLLLGIES